MNGIVIGRCESNTIVARSYSFTHQDVFCDDPFMPLFNNVCTGTEQEITQMIQELLEDL